MSQDVVNSMKELDGITVEEGSDVDAAKVLYFRATVYWL